MSIKLKFEYEPLMKDLENICVVAEDSESSDKHKSVLFRVSKDSVSLVATSVQAVVRKEVDSEYCVVNVSEDELDESGYTYFQLKCKDIMPLLRKYNQLNKTEVEGVIFEKVSDTMYELKILERFVKSEEEGKVGKPEGELQESKLRVVNRVIQRGVLNDINIEVANEEEEYEVLDMSIYKRYMKHLTSTLEKGSLGLSGRLVIEGKEEDVIAHSEYFKGYMTNEFPECFHNKDLPYRSLEILDKIFGGSNETVTCKLSDEETDRLHIKTDTIELFLKYKRGGVVATHEFKKYFVKEKAFVLDKVYLADVIKRVTLDKKDSVLVTVNPEESKFTLETVNTNPTEPKPEFKQTLEIQKKKNLEEVEPFTFKIAAGGLGDMILSDIDNTYGDLYVYLYERNSKETAITFTDVSNQWYSIVVVGKYR